MVAAHSRSLPKCAAACSIAREERSPFAEAPRLSTLAMASASAAGLHEKASAHWLGNPGRRKNDLRRNPEVGGNHGSSHGLGLHRGCPERRRIGCRDYGGRGGEKLGRQIARLRTASDVLKPLRCDCPRNAADQRSLLVILARKNEFRPLQAASRKKPRSLK